MAKAVSPADGPIAVTGASGYIGSWIVRDCVEQGYRVRACVRDASRPEKVDHLLALNDASLRGHVELAQGDIFQRGSYDAAFDGCCAVIHAGAAVGYNRETPQQVYDGCFTEVEHVLESARKSGTMRRFVFTSSFAAVGHPRRRATCSPRRTGAATTSTPTGAAGAKTAFQKTATWPTPWPRPTPNACSTRPPKKMAASTPWPSCRCM